MSADLAQEGVVEPSNPTDGFSDDESPDEQGDVIQSTIAYPSDGAHQTMISPTKGKDSDDDDDDFDDSEDGDEETMDDEHKERAMNPRIDDDVNNNAENENAQPHHRERPGRNENSCNRILGVYVAVLLVLVAIYCRNSPPPDPPLPICSRMPDPTTKSELDLSCPAECDEYDQSGNCLIYVPFSANEYSINARGTDCKLYSFP